MRMDARTLGIGTSISLAATGTAGDDEARDTCLRRWWIVRRKHWLWILIAVAIIAIGYFYTHFIAIREPIKQPPNTESNR